VPHQLSLKPPSFNYCRIDVAQTLLSVLVRLGTTEKMAWCGCG